MTPSSEVSSRPARAERPPWERAGWGRAGAAALAVYAAIVGATYAACVARTGGAYVYPIDDAYIHLAIAKHLVASGTYGVTDGAFAPASSSVAWPLLLAALRAAGLRDMAPLGVDLALGAALVVTVVRALHDAGIRGAAGAAAAIAIAVAIPIVPLVFSGMEHVLHALATLWLALAAARSLADAPDPRDPEGGAARSRADGPGPRDPEGGAPTSRPAAGLHDGAGPRGVALLALLAFLAALAASARYEAAALVVFLAALFARRGRWGGAGALVSGGLAPLVAQAAFAHAHGAPLVPVSVLLKRSRVDAWTWPAAVYYRLLEAPHALVLLAVLALVYALLRAPAGAWDRRALLVACGFVTLAAHVAAAPVGWFYRYEAYAMTLGLVAAAAAIGSLARERAHLWAGAAAWRYAAPLAIAILPITGRGVASLAATPAASANIFGQQVQMAAFLRAYYGGERVVVNDIGAVAYLSDVRLVDLVGLGSLDVARAKGMRIDQPLSRPQMEVLTEGARIAIVYDDWFAAALPITWRRAGRWRIHDNHVCAKDTVSFYAIARGEDEALAAHLRSFAARLPANVDDVDRPAAVRAE